MIKSFRHKGLLKLFTHDDPSGVQAKDVDRIKLRLLVLDEAKDTGDFQAYPGFKFHPLKGDKKNLFALYPRPHWARVYGVFC